MPELVQTTNREVFNTRVLGHEQPKRVINAAELLVEFSTKAQYLRHVTDAWLERVCGNAHLGEWSAKFQMGQRGEHDGASRKSPCAR
jgi:hypothetical protein